MKDGAFGASPSMAITKKHVEKTLDDKLIITYVDDNTCTLQSVNRTVDGELLPNIDEVKIKKQ